MRETFEDGKQFTHRRNSTHSRGKVSLAEGPPVAAIIGPIEADVRPSGGAQDGTVGAQSQGLDPPGSLEVVDGLSTCCCAPQVHTAWTRDREAHP